MWKLVSYEELARFVLVRLLSAHDTLELLADSLTNLIRNLQIHDYIKMRVLLEHSILGPAILNAIREAFGLEDTTDSPFTALRELDANHCLVFAGLTNGDVYHGCLCEFQFFANLAATCSKDPKYVISSVNWLSDAIRKFSQAAAPRCTHGVIKKTCYACMRRLRNAIAPLTRAAAPERIFEGASLGMHGAAFKSIFKPNTAVAQLPATPNCKRKAEASASASAEAEVKVKKGSLFQELG